MFSVDHVMPRHRGGQTTVENLALACQGCNGYKSTKTEASDPQTGALTPIFNPREQQWRDHFAWDASQTLVLGITATGRASVDVLRLNRAGLVNLRRLLIASGEHPPHEPD
jgi:hypothetical protein